MIAFTTESVLILISAMTAAVVSIINAWRTGQVRKEVTTMNAQSIAQLTDATETRRIDDIPADERTAKESGHLRAVPMDDT